MIFSQYTRESIEYSNEEQHKISINSALTWTASLIAGAAEENAVSGRTPVLVTWHLADAPLPLPRGWPTPVVRLFGAHASAIRRSAGVAARCGGGRARRHRPAPRVNDPGEPKSSPVGRGWREGGRTGGWWWVTQSGDGEPTPLSLSRSRLKGMILAHFLIQLRLVYLLGDGSLRAANSKGSVRNCSISQHLVNFMWHLLLLRAFLRLNICGGGTWLVRKCGTFFWSFAAGANLFIKCWHLAYFISSQSIFWLSTLSSFSLHSLKKAYTIEDFLLDQQTRFV